MLKLVVSFIFFGLFLIYIFLATAANIFISQRWPAISAL
uniref:Uncharacterized protein n=1 Tax=Anguilla anguilla TaxID=7936 RepID=A0A0E9UMB7_ANGAN